MPSLLPSGCDVIGAGPTGISLETQLRPWCSSAPLPDVLLVLAATETAEVQGISAAGATPESRRYTAIADAELFLHGPAQLPRWPLPPLPAGVSPALISWVAAQHLGLVPHVAAVGLTHGPPFAHLRLEAPASGPSACLSTGQAMALERVQRLWQRGYRLGASLRRPLVLAECVPGGTTTAQAVLQGLGIPVQDLVSGSAFKPPRALKQQLVNQGLAAANLGEPVSPPVLLAAVGDPFQALAAGLVVGTMESRQPLLLAGGSQMLAVIALAFSSCRPAVRAELAKNLVLGTTAWLADECLVDADEATGARTPPAFPQLLQRMEVHWGIPLLALTSGLRFHHSRHVQLRAYEQGHVKEGVGAGGLALLAQLRGTSARQLLSDCDLAMDALLQQLSGRYEPGGSPHGSLGSVP
ncbi:MAG: nicotinate-nucleotide--dimethylbenzimidazole phosphoribosyltransferase [Synechococcus sp.]|nr:nicotinate-nucleotide--dimethylbenzimidazole phosphoribosyltransferase [Synechococcus sp.]